MNRLTRFVLLLLTVFSLASCLEEENKVEPKVGNIYVINYGSYNGAKSEISTYNEELKQISQNAIKAVNNIKFDSNIQSASIYKGKLYCMSNNGDKIDIFEAGSLEELGAPIATDITKPRYFAAKGNYGYVSCWGEVAMDEWAIIPKAYIAKIDLTTNKVVKKIATPGGIEGVTIVGNKLYGAGYSIKKLAILDLTTDVVSYVDLKAVARQIVEGKDGLLWISVVNSYSVTAKPEEIGLQVFDTKTNLLKGFVNFSGIGNNGYIGISKDKNTIYAMGAETDNSTKTNVYKVDANEMKFAPEALIEGEKYYGFGVNPVSEKLYILISPSTIKDGTMEVYSNNGKLEDSQATGVGPQHVVFEVF